MEKFNGSKRYYKDSRYIDLVITYVRFFFFYNYQLFNVLKYFYLKLKASRYRENPDKLFEWMENHNMGVTTAKFYIEWSNCLCKKMENQRAIQILKIGIDRKAIPISELMERLNQLDVSTQHSEYASYKENLCEMPFGLRQKIVVSGKSYIIIYGNGNTDESEVPSEIKDHLRKRFILSTAFKSKEMKYICPYCRFIGFVFKGIINFY
jgi:hypothetical protein